MLVIYYIVTVVFTMELAMAIEQCEDYRFQPSFFLGNSCQEIYNMNPESHERPGYYWITEGPSQIYCGMNYTGSSCEDIYMNNPETGDRSGYYRIDGTQWTYCDMVIITCFAGDAGVRGGWRTVINIDISGEDSCPSGWRSGTNSGRIFCRIESDNSRTCSSASFPVSGMNYQRVCGRARGYQKGATDSFLGANNNDQDINGYYVDGLSITYDSPRQHIWTYTTGPFDNQRHQHNCPCARGGGLSPPSFVGANSYCESGATNVRNDAAYYFNDPLWDRSGCVTSNCCDIPNQPWFYSDLGRATTSNIEAQLCTHDRFALNSVLIDQLELYVQ